MAEQDTTEEIRDVLRTMVNAAPGSREQLELVHGQVWDAAQLRGEFEVLWFGAPLIVVRRLSDGQKGSLFFQHHPRYFFGWEPHHE